MSNLTKKQFNQDNKGIKFSTSNGAQLAYLIASSDHAKTELFSFINGLDTPQQIEAINDYLSSYTGDVDFNKKVLQIKQWCSRVVESLGHARIKVECEKGFSLQWPKGIATIKAQSTANQASSKTNGAKTTATKKANAKTVQKAANIQAKAKAKTETTKTKTVKPVSSSDTTSDDKSVGNFITVDLDNLDRLSDEQVYSLINALESEIQLRGLKAAA